MLAQTWLLWPCGLFVWITTSLLNVSIFLPLHFCSWGYLESFRWVLWTSVTCGIVKDAGKQSFGGSPNWSVQPQPKINWKPTARGKQESISLGSWGARLSCLAEDRVFCICLLSVHSSVFWEGMREWGIYSKGPISTIGKYSCHNPFTPPLLPKWEALIVCVWGGVSLCENAKFVECVLGYEVCVCMCMKDGLWMQMCVCVCDLRRILPLGSLWGLWDTAPDQDQLCCFDMDLNHVSGDHSHFPSWTNKSQQSSWR